MTNNERIKDEVKVEENLGASDRNIIRYTLNVLPGTKLPINKEMILGFKNGGYSKFRVMLKIN